MSAIIKVPEDEQKYEEVMKTIEKLKNYCVQSKDTIIKGNPYYIISLKGLGIDERATVIHEIYKLRRDHGIKVGLLDYAAAVLLALAKKGKPFPRDNQKRFYI